MTTTRGLSCIIFASRSFCWLPPDIWPASRFLSPTRMSKRWIASSSALALLGAVDQRPALELVERGERQVGRDRLLEQQAFALAVLGQIDGAGAHAGARVAPLLRRAVEPDFAAALAQPEQRLEQFGPPRADQPGEAEDFARPHAEARVLGEARRAEMRDFERRLSGRRRRARRIEGEKVAPDHQARHVERFEFGRRAASPPACRRAAP